MVTVEYTGSAIIQEWQSARLTRKIFKVIVNECLNWAMNCPEHDEMAEVNVGSGKYFICADTWMDGSRVFGEVNVFENLDYGIPMYSKQYILAD